MKCRPRILVSRRWGLQRPRRRNRKEPMFDGNDDQIVRPRVKICGITRPGDAIAAIESGADALGFNFFPGSKRYIPIGESRDWIAALPRAIAKVAGLVDPDWNDARAAA